MSSIIQPTEQERVDLQYILDQIEHGKCHKLNLSDEKQNNYIQNLYRNNGYTPNRYPMLFKSIEDQKNTDMEINNRIGLEVDKNIILANQPGFGNLNKITMIGSVEKGTKSSSIAFSTIIGGTTQTTLILRVFEYKGRVIGKLLATKNVMEHASGEFVPIQAIGDISGHHMLAVLNYSYVKDGVPTNGMLQMETRKVLVDPEVTEPAQWEKLPSSRSNIQIALSRGSYADDVDYWFNKGLLYDTTIIVPLVGNSSYESNIITPLEPSKNLMVNVTVAIKGGGASTSPNNINDVYKEFSIGPDPRTLNWKLSAGPNRDGTKGNPIIFEKSPWRADTVTYLDCSIGVQTQNSAPLDFVWSYILSSDMPDEDPLDGVAYIKPLQFMWHCLAKGTNITLADGTELPIQDVDNTCSVRIDSKGNSLSVRGTTRAEARSGEVIILKTSDGKTLTLSDCHVVVTPDGFKQVNELVPGSNLVSINGVVEVLSIEMDTEYNGKLYNLILGTHEQQKTLDDSETTLFANGIKVGDYQVQEKYRDIMKNDKTYILNKLHPDWHLDYLSSLEDQAENR